MSIIQPVVTTGSRVGMETAKKPFSVGQMAEQTGCKVETVRYYEKEGLMPQPPRTEGGHRQYDRNHLKRLYFIRRSRELGFSIEQVRELLQYVDEPDHSCGEVRAMTVKQAREVQGKIDDLKRLQKALNDMSAKCSSRTFSIEDCPIIDALFEDRAERR